GMSLGLLCCIILFSFTATPPTEIYTLSLHDALPISVRPRARDGVAQRGQDPPRCGQAAGDGRRRRARTRGRPHRRRSAEPRLRRSEEHTSELQSRFDLVCRLLLEKKNTAAKNTTSES